MHYTAQMEQFSRAFVGAITAQAGCNSSKPEVDDDSVDLMLIKKGIEGCKRPRAQMDIQIKCTAKTFSGSCLTFPLPKKNYDDLREEHLVPRLLVIVCVPELPENWIEQDAEKMSLYHCAYWFSLRGLGESENVKTVTLSIPKDNVFSTDFLNEAMRRIANGGTI
ncbi:MAG: DUF4365 domain-containing protein [Proteobacteria bacterium]|nr:DUF4365 domain-containing protein [Pseudomonadota bacterium]